MRSLLGNSGLENGVQYNGVTENAAFKTWFSGSMIKNDSGYPLLMFHGTYLDFDAFASDHGIHFFTPDTALAEYHARDSHWHFKNERQNTAIIMMPVFIRALRPFDPRIPECIALMDKWRLGRPDEYNYAEFDLLEDVEVVDRVQALGFDGIWMREENSYDVLAIFHPRQVKSAIGNSGRFDPLSASLTDPL